MIETFPSGPSARLALRPSHRFQARVAGRVSYPEMTNGTIEVSGLSLASATCWGGGDFAGGLAAKRANVFRVVAVAHACGLVAMLAMALLAGEAFPPAADLEWGAAAGIAGAFGIAALYQALAIGRMGVMAPVASVVTGVLPVLVGIRTEGMPDRIQMIGFALALMSIWLVARPNESVDSHRGLGLAVLAGLMFGLFLVAGKQAGHHGVFWPMVAARLASTGLMLAIVAISPRDPRPLIPVLWPMVFSGRIIKGRPIEVGFECDAKLYREEHPYGP